MSEMTTDEIYKHLSKAAMDKESNRIWGILTKCYSDLGLSSSSFKVGVRNPDNKEMPSYFIGVYELFAQIRDQRLKGIKPIIEKQAVDDFLKSVETFKKHMSELEQYRLDGEE